MTASDWAGHDAPFQSRAHGFRILNAERILEEDHPELAARELLAFIEKNPCQLVIS